MVFEAGDSIKPGGVSPRKGRTKVCEPVKTGERRVDLRAVFKHALSPAIAGSNNSLIYTWGLTPQALCFRPLRGLPPST